jgi:hypothetical protein
MSAIEERMSNALAARLESDHPEVFDEKTWKADTLDKFYPDETFVDLVVLQVAQNVCDADHLAMPTDVKRALASDVNLKSKGQDAVDAMVVAHAKADSMPVARGAASSHGLLAHHVQQFASFLSAIAPPSPGSAKKTGQKAIRKAAKRRLNTKRGRGRQ